MTELTQPQLDFLGVASAGGIIAAANTSHKTIAALLKRGLIVAGAEGQEATGYAITDAGRAALGADASSGASEPEGLTLEPVAEIEPVMAKGKIATLVEMLRQPDGATLDAMMDATGWQAHSIRGAISGAIKKGLGHTVASEKTMTGRCYRILGAGE